MKKTLRSIFNFGPGLVVSGSVLWALDGVLRRSLFSLPAVVIVFLEHLIGFILLVPVLLQNWQLLRTAPRKVWLLVSIIAVLSGLLGTLWFTAALQAVNFLPFSVVYLLLQLEPIFAVSAAVIFLKEKLSKEFLFWAGIALVVALFVIFPNGQVNWQTGSGTIMAALLTIGATAAWGTSTVFSKMLLKEVPDQVATALRFGATTLLAGVAVAYMGVGSAIATVTLPQLITLLMISLSTGMVALYLYYRGLQRTEAKLTTFLELVFPCLAVVIDAVLYKSVLQPSQYIAAIVLIIIMVQLVKVTRQRASAA